MPIVFSRPFLFLSAKPINSRLSYHLSSVLYETLLLTLFRRFFDLSRVDKYTYYILLHVTIVYYILLYLMILYIPFLFSISYCVTTLPFLTTLRV